MLDSALTHYFPFCYVNKIWSSKWKEINSILASSSFGSVFPNFLLLLSLLKGCKMLRSSVGEISFVSPFLARVEIISKQKEKRFLHVRFSVSSLVPWESPGAISLYMTACRDTTPLPTAWGNAQDWDLRGEKIPGKCWGHVLHYVRNWPLPSSLRFSRINSHLSWFAATAWLRMLWVLPLSRPQRVPSEVSATFQGIMQWKLWGALVHLPQQKTTLISPADFVWDSWDKFRSFPLLVNSVDVSRHPQKWELGTSTRVLQELTHRETPGWTSFNDDVIWGKKEIHFFIQQNLKLDQPFRFPVTQRTLA